MHLTVTGKQTDTGDALRRHVEASLGSILGKYFKAAIEAHVVFSKEAHMSRAEISLHIGRGIVVNAGAAAVDTYTAYDAAAERIAEQPEEEDVGGGPTVVAEMSTELPNLTVSEAVMRMDLADAQVLLFRSRSHGELNLVYRRADGNIGWIDPELDPTRRTRRREG